MEVVAANVPESSGRDRALKSGRSRARRLPTPLEIGADPQPADHDGFPPRGINDYTALHMAVSEGKVAAAEILLRACLGEPSC
jgi:hypothetical protein